MLKAPLMASLFASLLMGVTIASNTRTEKRPERNKTIIVEVDRDSKSLTEEGIEFTQDRVIENIKAYATTNIELTQRFHNIGNLIVLDVNEDDIELIKQVPGVKSITLDEAHGVTSLPDEVENEGVLEIEEEGSSDYGGSDNVSAETMYKPDDTYDGEGTTIAIIDNEFYFRAPTVAEGYSEDEPFHETFTAFSEEENVAVKHQGRPDNYKKTEAYKKASSSDVATDDPQLVVKDATGKVVKLDDIPLGKEGSFYLNNKVPFYFDYGGEKAFSGDREYHSDYNVSTLISYHGSHVASIAAGHAEAYKGIAPKAQLICMKVASTYRATDVDKAMGLSSSSSMYDVSILTAIEDALTLEVDGINMSLGSSLDDFDANSITLRKLTELVNAGILTAISAGNSGKSSYSALGAYANWTKDMAETGIFGSYSNNKDIMAVASGQPDRIFYKNAFKLAYGDNQTATIEYEDQIVNREGYDKDYQKEHKMVDLLKGDPSKTLDWVYVRGFGQDQDYTESADYYDGKIIVVNRGSTSFADKYAIAYAHSAKGLIIINNDPTASSFNFRCSFGETQPKIPVALVLFKDKSIFENGQKGSFNLIENQVDENPYTRTISSFSSDGGTYNLDLKPEITTPGENIRGAVPPQKKEDKEERPNSTYEFLSGTSMAAPNYAGAQSVLLSKVTGPIYETAKAAGRSVTDQEKAQIDTYRRTVDMRYMSTATPMTDVSENPEDGKFSYTSPRIQGAGMANIANALNTQVYFEGFDDDGVTGLHKSKLVLRNNADIQEGKISLSFLAHNESQQTKNYKVKLVVMRPAIAATADIITKEYNDRGEVSEIASFPGFTYWEVEGIADFAKNVQRTSVGTFANKDVLEVTKDIEYFKTEEDLIANKPTVIAKGKYYNAGDDKVADWQPLPTYQYQSPVDKVIAEVNLQTIAIAPGNSTVTLNRYEIDDDAKAEIAQFFEYGCYLEGYVMFESQNNDGIDLSMPYMG